jgi:hypothetical protein
MIIIAKGMNRENISITVKDGINGTTNAITSIIKSAIFFLRFIHISGSNCKHLYWKNLLP